MNHTESEMQQNVIQWAAMSKHKEILRFLHHSPNGGKRNAIEAARFKREGVKSGFPDLILPVPVKGYHGLFIEMKAPKGRTTDSQKEWTHFLKLQGYAVYICYSDTEAIETITDYLEGRIKNE